MTSGLTGSLDSVGDGCASCAECVDVVVVSYPEPAPNCIYELAIADAEGEVTVVLSVYADDGWVITDLMGAAASR